jgi:hypothetical protein
MKNNNGKINIQNFGDNYKFNKYSNYNLQNFDRNKNANLKFIVEILEFNTKLEGKLSKTVWKYCIL